MVAETVDIDLDIESGLRARPDQREVSSIEKYCLGIISAVETRRTDFHRIPAVHSSNFAFGTITTHRLEDLRNSPQADGLTALNHVSRYCLARYLAINRSDPNLNRRGFYSWGIVAEEGITEDPDFEKGYQPDDLSIVVHNRDGLILGHLRISKPEQQFSSLPLDSTKRENALMEIEQIHGPFLENLSGTQDVTLGELRILTRLSRVSNVPNIPLSLQRLAKAKITTHLVANAFTTIQQLRNNGDPIFGAIFDGEKYATDSIRLLGLDVEQFPSEINPEHVPSILTPRYFINNKGPVTPHLVRTNQLDNERNRRLYERIESNNTLTFVQLMMKHLLQQVVGRSLL